LVTFKVGLRAENNIQTLSSRTTTGDPVEVNNPILSILPSSSLTLNLSETMLIKAAYGQTINRPEFRELAPFGFYDFNFNFTNRGNPNLQTPTVHNFDVRWELYPSVSEVLSVAVFHKQFYNPIEVTFVPGAGSGGAKNFTYNNAQSAISQGVEVEFRKYFRDMFASNFMNNLGIALNASIIKSEVELGEEVAIGQSNIRPLQGQAPYLVNGGLFYNNLDKEFQVNLQYNVIGKRILFIGFEGYPDIYEMPRHSIDLSFSKRIYKNITINGGIADILNMPVQLLQDGNQDGIFDRVKDQTIQSFRPGQIVSLGLRWIF
jgi:outer membrane receptor protein involved in Fe transport